MQTRSVGAFVTTTILLLALGACRNGQNNPADTNGVSGSAGQLAPDTGMAPPAVAPNTTPDTTGASAMPTDTLGAPNSATDTVGSPADTSAKKPTKHTARKKHA